MNDAWMQSASGRTLDFDNIDPTQIRIDDIAHSLSRINRYLGHTRVSYSVAEHCVRVSWLLEEWGHDREIQLRGLLHDAAEAYVGDTTAPVKRWIRRQTYALDVLEERIERAILTRFGLAHMRSDPPLPMADVERLHAIVKRADLVMLATEYRDLVPKKGRDWCLAEEAHSEGIVPMATADGARDLFLDRFYALGGAK
jgi:5'-deoxynucleotidase YfbR-like HD superfamily hydrolase